MTNRSSSHRAFTPTEDQLTDILFDAYWTSNDPDYLDDPAAQYFYEHVHAVATGITAGPHQELITRLDYATGHLHNPYPDLPGPVFSHNDRFTFVAIPTSGSTSQDALNALAYLYAAQELPDLDQTNAGKAAARAAAALDRDPEILRIFTQALHSFTSAQ